MESIKEFIYGPDPQKQLRKCNVLLRGNIRKIDREIASAKQAEQKAKNLILQANRRAQRDPTRAAQAQREVRDFARELIRVRRATDRLVTGRAQLDSVQMQVKEAFAMRKIQGSMRASVGVMRSVNQLTRLPELAGTMQQLSMELMRAGIVEEMVNETLPEDDDALFEDEEAETEVDKVLGEILKDRMATPGATPAALPASPAPAPASAVGATAPVAVPADADADEEDMQAVMEQMRSRLESLRS